MPHTGFKEHRFSSSEACISIKTYLAYTPCNPHFEKVTTIRAMYLNHCHQCVSNDQNVKTQSQFTSWLWYVCLISQFLNKILRISCSLGRISSHDDRTQRDFSPNHNT